MKIIFLDIDGVLNTSSTLPNNSVSSSEILNPRIETALIEKVNKIVEKTGAEVVLSSSWRCGYNLKQIEKLFKERGARFDLNNKTPVLVYERDQEIRQWLSNNVVESFVILDDMASAGNGFEDNFILISDGLTDANMEQAINILRFGSS